MTQECTRILRDMMECDVRCLAEIGLNRTQRVEFLNAVLVYFRPRYFDLDATSVVAVGADPAGSVLREL